MSRTDPLLPLSPSPSPSSSSESSDADQQTENVSDKFASSSRARHGWRWLAQRIAKIRALRARSRKDRSFHALPMELCFHVMEQATLSDSATGASLCLVSKRVRNVVEPLLYQTVLLKDYSAMFKFQVAVRQKPPGFLNKNVRNLSWDRIASINVDYFFLVCDSNFVTFSSVSNLFIPSPRALSSHSSKFRTNLEELTLKSNRHYHVFPLDSQAFANLTHWDVGKLDMDWEFTEILSGLTKLTHFACSMLHIKGWSMHNINRLVRHIDVVLNKMPKTRVKVCLVEFYDDRQLPDIGQSNPVWAGVNRRFDDARLVLVPGFAFDNNSSNWLKRCRGEKDKWDIAEEIVRTRQNSEKSNQLVADEGCSVELR